jgi:hypothetical protein
LTAGEQVRRTAYFGDVRIDASFILASTLALAFVVCIVVARRVTRPRLLKMGAHSLAAARKRLLYSCLNGMRKRITEAVHRTEPAPAAEVGGAPHEVTRIVRKHRVASDRLMDLPTGRLWPSTRHRVPPWVTSHDSSVPPKR